MMNRPIKFWEFMIAVIGVIVTISTLIYNRGTMEGENYQKQVNIEKRLDGHDAQLKKMDENMSEQNRHTGERLDKINDNLVDVKILLQNKQDRR